MTTSISGAPAPTHTDTPLVPVFSGQIGGMPAQVCDGRTLHTFLENRKQFADWIKHRIDTYGFVENQDFASFSLNSEKPKGGRPTLDYHLSLDMAKELSMVENNDKGRLARRYFIAMERQALGHSPISPELAQARADIGRLERQVADLQGRLIALQDDKIAALEAAQTRPERHARPPLTPAEHEQIRVLLAQGLSASAVAKRLGRSAATVSMLARGMALGAASAGGAA